MWLTNIARSIEKVIYPVTRLSNRAAQGVLSIMMTMVAVDVFLRNIVNAPIFGSYELTEFSLLCLVFLSIAFTQVEKAHIRVDFILIKLSDKMRAIVEALYYFMSLICFSLIAWQSFITGMEALRGEEISGLLEIPLYPFYWLAAFGTGLLCLVYLVNLIDALVAALKILKKNAWAYFTGAAIIFLFIASIPWWPNVLPWTLSPGQMGILGVVLMMVLIFTGMPISSALGGIGFLGFAYLGGIEGSLGIMGTYPYITASSYTMSAIPLFVLMGMFCFHSELSSDIYGTFRHWIGRLPGGLAMATVGGCAGFAAVSGSSLASTATMGTVALPEMKKYNYDDGLACGCIAAGASIGILIPPSIPFIIYAMLTEESVGKLFFAGIIPGILEAIFYMLVIYMMCRFNPTLAPLAPRSSMKEKIISLKGTWGILILFIIVIGGIYAGIFTPSEAAGIGAAGALLLGLVRGRLDWKKISASISASCRTTGMLFIMIVGGDIFAQLLTTSNIPFEIANFVAGLQVPAIMALILILLVYVVLGFFMPIFLIIILTVPIFLPVIIDLGYSPIWVGVLIVMVGEMGAISPPFGMNAFIIQGVAKTVPLTTIYRGVMPFVCTDVFRVALVVIFPSLAMYLPSLLK